MDKSELMTHLAAIKVTVCNVNKLSEPCGPPVTWELDLKSLRTQPCPLPKVKVAVPNQHIKALKEA